MAEKINRLDFLKKLGALGIGGAIALITIPKVFSTDLWFRDVNLKFNEGVSINKILDEDDMASDSVVALATQQSIKKYVDDNVLSVSFNIDQTGGTADTYGVLAGSVNSSNKVFTTSASKYVSGSLTVYLNGQLQTQGSSEDWVETTPASGTFTFAVAPTTGDEITAVYKVSAGASGDADTLDGIEGSAFVQKASADDITHSADSDWTLKNSASDRDMLVKINDGGVDTTAIQIHGTEGSVSMPRQSHVLVKKTSNQSISNTTTTLVAWESEVYDTLNEFTSNIFTAKTAGVYSVNLNIHWSNPSAGFYQVLIATTPQTFTHYVQIPASGGFSQSHSAVVYLSVGGTIRANVWQSTSATQTIRGALNSESNMSIVKVA